MNKETQNYIEGIKHNIEEIRNKQVLPKWQIDFEKYGGRVAYEEIKKIYWELADDYLHGNIHRNNGERYEATNFPFYKGEAKHKNGLEMFRKDLHVKLDIPKKYDIYR